MVTHRISVLAVVLAVLLHLPSLVGFSGGLSGKERLPLDGPVFAANTAFETGSVRSTVRTLAHAFADPSVGFRSTTTEAPPGRYRPLSTAVFVVERAVGGARATTLVAAVSLALHVLLVMLTGSLVGRLRGPPSARALAMLLVAVSPFAFGTVDWPAQQAVVLAAVLGTSGLVLALRADGSRAWLAGIALAAAGLSHELAFGLVPAALWLRSRAAASDGVRGAAGPSAIAVALPGLLAALLWLVLPGRLGAEQPVLPGLPAPAAADLAFRSVADGLTGIVLTLLDFALPTRVRIADGPWTSHLAARLGAALALWLLLHALIVRRRRADCSVGLAALISLAPLLFAPYRGASPAHVTYAYLALPLFATWTGLGVTAAVRGGAGRTRLAAIAAGAMLLAATFAATESRLGAARTRSGFVTAAVRETGDGPVARAWRLAELIGDLPRDPAERRRVLREAAPLAASVVASLTDGTSLEQYANRLSVSPWAADPVGATQVGEPLLVFGLYTANAGFEAHERILETAEESASAATFALPRSSAVWSGLAAVRNARGALRGALDAATKGYLLAPGSLDAARELGRAGLEIGDARFAADLMLGARERALVEGRSVDPDFDLLLARALTEDGSRLDTVGRRPFHRFERAILLLEPIAQDPVRAALVQRLLHDAYLLYGDFLASADAAYLARRSYEKAVEILPSTVAREHLGWLTKRIDKEFSDARYAYEQAQRGLGSIPDAMVRVAAALCRAGRFEEADQAFEALSKAQGGMNAALRYLHAKHRLAWSPTPEDQRRGIAELEQALKDEPDLHVARFELAKLLEKNGQPERALEAYRIVARKSYDTLEGLEALDDARRLGLSLTQSRGEGVTLPPQR